MIKNLLFKISSLLVVVIFIISCSGGLTENEKKTIEKYTQYESHDSSLFGKWINNETFKHQEKNSQIAISFDEKGINNERMYVENIAFNDWHLMYYYYTKESKIYMYRPAEKGFMAMDDEIFLEYEYKVSEDGKLLSIGDNIYSKIE